uniref:Uncharacterized protein n=1 Tax=Ascaris lumbricoides TaxID=6252 RepID=A0A0M3IHU1_ASCLU
MIICESCDNQCINAFIIRNLSNLSKNFSTILHHKRKSAEW